MAKTATQQQIRIDELMDQASAALVERDYFKCERVGMDALRRAHALQDFDRMARILLPVQEARRQKRDLARDSGRTFVVNDQLPSGRKLVAGCYLVTPPRVGVDGRLLRGAADEKGVPVVVLVREPTTRDGLWPIVAVGPVTVRAKVTPPGPSVPSKRASERRKASAAAMQGPGGESTPPPPEWFVEASESLGDAAIEQIMSTAPAATRVDHLFQRLEAVPDHEKLHQRLGEACRAALLEPPPKRRPVDESFDDDGDV